MQLEEEEEEEVLGGGGLVTEGKGGRKGRVIYHAPHGGRRRIANYCFYLLR